MNICILGAGSWGSALSMVLADNGHQVKLWTRNEDQCHQINAMHTNPKYLKEAVLSDAIVATTDLKAAIADTAVVVIAVASQSIRSVLEQTGGCIMPSQIVVNVSKGIEVGSLDRISEIVTEFYPVVKFVALSGPSHAEEVAAKLPTTLVSSSVDLETAEFIQDLFNTEYMRIYTNTDIIGVELGGALKNIIALGAGISDGMGFGDNSKAALMTRGIREISLLGEKMGADMSSFSGLSGIGDLIVTCTSMHSRNRRCGILIGEGMPVDEAVAKIGMVVEGIYTIRSAYDLSLKYNVEMPITHALYHVVYEGVDARDAVKSLMTRAKKHEMEAQFRLV
ncbi:MAG: NAD(P)H-dependent glycerol-3-phosphate dehydrogenase [Clostridia bacterium]|nr:NAD(P)H-dependent glycerol-3-phosphate dehydrogenase [Clostridia bacterium]